MESGQKIKPSKDILCLFDIDGTLAPARKTITPEMDSFMKSLASKVTVAIVGGSDFAKAQEQLVDLSTYEYIFAENGLTAFKNGKSIGHTSIIEFLGEKKIKEFVNYVLKYIANIEDEDITVKRGTFIEFRTGMLNVSPIGRNCSHEERAKFYEFDKVSGLRKKMVADFQKRFPVDEWKLAFAIGGQISFDVFPVGWDKTYCLRYVGTGDSPVEGAPKFSQVHFFGDKTYKGGNDYEIFASKYTIGHTVKDPQDTKAQLEQMFDL